MTNPEAPGGLQVGVGRPKVSAGKAFHYMVSAFVIGWNKRLATIRQAQVGLRNKGR